LAWVASYISRWYTRSNAVTHLSTNRAQRRVTWSIRPMPLPLCQTVSLMVVMMLQSDKKSPDGSTLDLLDDQPVSAAAAEVAMPSSAAGPSSGALAPPRRRRRRALFRRQPGLVIPRGKRTRSSPTLMDVLIRLAGHQNVRKKSMRTGYVISRGKKRETAETD